MKMSDTDRAYYDWIVSLEKVRHTMPTLEWVDMIQGLPEKVQALVYANNEYPMVLHRSEHPLRLKRLDTVRIDRDTASELVIALCDEFGLRYPSIRFTGRTDRGMYFPTGEHFQTIRVRASKISVELLLHELAHHWVELACKGTEDGHHGWDFTSRLDRLAAKAEEWRIEERAL